MSDCFAPGPAPLSLSAAHALLGERIGTAVGIEAIPLRNCRGRILAEDIIAPFAQPPFTNAAMDGYAVRHADLLTHGPTRLAVGDRIAAGHPLSGTAVPGQAVEIFTGAPLPIGVDTVVMIEQCHVETIDGVAMVTVPAVPAGQHVRPAGEDFDAQTIVLRAGRRLRPQDIAMAAATGRTSLAVYQHLKVGVFSTGDELIQPGAPLAPGQIYDSNRYGMIAALEALGHEVTDLGHLPDDASLIRQALAAACDRFHVLVTSGGVSVGGEDHVKAVVERLGSLHFWRLALKPGKPVALGRIGQASFLGLPGNPVSAVVTLLVVGRTLLNRLSGASAEPPLPLAVPVTAGFSFRKTDGRRQFLRASLSSQPSGTVALAYPRQDSNILSSLVDSDGLVNLAESVTGVSPGDMVDFLSYSGLLW